MPTYIVVADAGRARIFTHAANKLTEKESLVHAEGQMHEGDLVTDSPGADVHTGSQGSARSSAEGGEALEHENEMFAKQVVQYLFDARTSNKMDELILIAAPKFLGLLRDKLDKPTQKLVTHTLSKDYTKASSDEIEEAIKKL
ncbi:MULTISPECIES: host attachment protein [unclassified Halomonas]|uniref:host attachment protein n=1 Tax=unclassified Halomonas TaxID=2609666 RepID=UPI0021E37A92|nr:MULTISPECIES: host attachment protein [unclassified Halomonas]UYF99741.1 host attachment protein [Halomonas sp. GD1P12]WNL39165.1 host attachment protein [Halomonas sp. PAMB 3232]WNL42508.1 host attachment protein [Halomonas sp. PAMB 3264]